jgi:N-acetylglutamate synthase-like GNAT family acetyltransferase
MGELTFNLNLNPTPEGQKVIREGIINFNQSIINDKPGCFTVSVKKEGAVVGGAIIYLHKDALYLDVIWCVEECRGQGIGTKIISMLENEAKRTNKTKLFVDTYAFQAQDFYLKQGFKIIGKVPGYLLGYDRIFFLKEV